MADAESRIVPEGMSLYAGPSSDTMPYPVSEDTRVWRVGDPIEGSVPVMPEGGTIFSQELFMPVGAFLRLQTS